VLPNRAVESIQAIYFVLNHSVTPADIVIGRLWVEMLDSGTDDSKAFARATVRAARIGDFRRIGVIFRNGFRTM